MNLHGHLVTEGILYGSKDSIDFMDHFMEAMNYYSLKSSMEMAKEKAATFYRFEDSDYASGSYFDQYINKTEEELSPAVLKALGKIQSSQTRCGKR